MSLVTSLIMHQMRIPMIVLILGYSISILGMVIAPGIDAQGNPWHMSFFEAFYFVSFTATTIGFGEIPFAFSNIQRAWALVTVYITVIAWFYSIGKIVSLVQDPVFRDAIKKNRFAKQIERIPDSFILVCGFGETGYALIKSLTEYNKHVVVIEQEESIIQTLALQEFNLFVPGFLGDSRNPEVLIQAGLQHTKCRAVIALTASDESNLKIAVASKLLHPDINVICRSEFSDYEENMFSFGTNFVANPFNTFAKIFSMAMYSPSLYLLYDWLTGVPNTDLTNPIYIKKGNWIICGFGRFGYNLYQKLLNSNIKVTVIDPSKEKRDEFLEHPDNKHNTFILGTGYDKHTLTIAGAENAAGLISGTDNDTNNLSIIMTAREINPNLFIVARHNKKSSKKLFNAAKADIIMLPSEIIARKIRTLLVTPLVNTFLNEACSQEPSWANIAISRIIGTMDESTPIIWTLEINKKEARAFCHALNLGRVIHLNNLLQDPLHRERKVKAIAILLKRKHTSFLMPTDDVSIKENDQILFCGTASARRSMEWSHNDLHSLSYIMTYEDTADGYIWRKYRQFMKKRARHKRQKEKHQLSK